MNAAEIWQARQAQWKTFERWHRDEDPATRVSPQEALRWAGEMMEWYEKRHGPPPVPVAADYAGVRTMHERLALLPRRP